MGNGFDIYTLLFLILAVVVFLRLKNVLGRRTGNERPPYDPFTASSAKANGANDDVQDKVVALPRARGAAQADTLAEAEKRLKGYAPRGSPLAKGLMAVMKSDSAFDPEQFLDGAKAAYEMIVVAFAGGSKTTLRQLLGTDVYDGFVSAIEEREQRGESVESSFIGIDKADMIEAAIKQKSALITVKFVSKLITSTSDKDGNIIDGNPKKVREVTDIWTFARSISSRDPNWRLVATEAAN